MTVFLRSAGVGVCVQCDDGGSALRGIIRYNWVKARTIVFIRDCGVGAGTVMIEVSAENGRGVFRGILRYHWV